MGHFMLFAQSFTDGLPHASANHNTLETILNVVFTVTASITLLVIVIAGLRYIIARGDPQATAQARETITYAVVGLIITLAAFGIVTFVLKGLS